MGVCVDDDVLASVRGVVDLLPHEALDEAQDFLTQQGYSVMYRTSTTLTVKRQVSENASGQESIFKLIVMALPQPGGGVRIKVRGNDREAVRDHQAAWLEWSETLPKRETEQRADNDVPQRRYCSNCGQPLDPNDQFCQSCGQPVHQTARIPTPQAYVSTPPPPQSQQGYRDPGVWTGVKLGCGMFIVLPILIALFIWVVIIFLGNV